MKTPLLLTGFLTICTLLSGQVTHGLVGHFPFTNARFRYNASVGKMYYIFSSSTTSVYSPRIIRTGRH